ncbi:hypothetical protein AYO48_04025, partial [Gaiella sp. SCGC AG-212-M14]
MSRLDLSIELPGSALDDRVKQIELRGSWRNRRIGITALVSLLSRGTNLIVVFISIPLTLHYLGPELFGAWAALTSIVTMASFADMGISNGLVNVLAEAFGRNSREAARRAVASGIVMLTVLGVAIGALFFGVVAWTVNWATVVSATPAEADQLRATALVLAACFLLSLPLNASQRVNIAYQDGFIAAAWAIVGMLLSLLGLVVAIHADAGVVGVTAAMAGGPVAAAAANSIHSFWYRYPWLRPRRGDFAVRTATILCRLGGLFFVLQMAFSFAYSADNVIVARVLGANAVAQYAIPAKLFGLVLLVVGAIAAPLWPAYAEASARGDFEWVRKTLVRSLACTGAFACAVAVPLFIFGESIIQRWVGHDIHPSRSLLLGCAVWAVLGSIGTTIAMLLNGLSVIRDQVVIALTMAAANVGLSVWLTGRI